MTRLEKLVAELNIPTKPLSEMQFNLKRPSDEGLKQLLQYFHSAFDGEEIIFGGTTAQPLLRGYRRLRNPSNNLDYAVSKTGIRNLHKEFGNHQLFYDPRDFLYMSHEGMRVQCFHDNIFNWYGGSRFKEESTKVNLDGTELLVAAPEYSIMLKFRKAEELRLAHPEEPLSKLLAGKDRGDIYTLFLSPFFRNADERQAEETIRHIAERTAQMCYEHVTKDMNQMGSWLRTLYEDMSSLNAAERVLMRSKIGGIITERFAVTYSKSIFGSYDNESSTSS